MSFEEKRTWIYLVVTALSYAGYVALVLARAQGVPLADVPYAGAMLGAIGIAILASIVGTIALSIATPKEAHQKDERDRAIDRYGDVVGYFVSSVGVAGALALTMAEADHFWIANAIYLAFVLAALVSTTVKLVAHRRGFAPW
ncbi:hypothetical protein [Sandaracinus amylolyticus]|uniref:Integral membrane protein n=1 Tax=Sandaracinus amylolyticus TaxID=927083 RepID=A0A0F6W261_9BACT|nr:hypothetical protein [Sandaracinus amylolyticus]AKF05498.1 hypothetical protein DB32_002647 [Sandaracinus amylolyticus]